jgi:hypothetical protein
MILVDLEKAMVVGGDGRMGVVAAGGCGMPVWLSGCLSVCVYGECGRRGLLSQAQGRYASARRWAAVGRSGESSRAGRRLCE